MNSRRGLRGFLCFSSVADIPCSFHHISGVHGTGPGSELRHRVDLPGLISRHVALTPSGKEFRGRCPFHEERTPSFFVV
ncbi:CHC2 zinc finger domain-containing protein, partial [Corallococcus exiguus]|uniref:CHC2 zinc finger domain-containing protein n=1 Tax=Corallococcus exiguus TaxID=83462 RepID=UPI0034CF440F